MNRTQQLVETLTARIQEGAITPGQKMPTESALVETYGVSRTVVREAISRLAAAGLIETQHGRGSFVLARPSTTTFDPGPHNVLDLLELRVAMEVEAAGLAATRRTDRALADLREALDRLAAAGDHPSTAVNADYQFHLRIALATGNRYFADLLASFGPSMIVVPRDRLAPEPAAFARIVAEHENIYAAIERRDSEGARAAVRVHLSNSRARLAAAMTGAAT